MAFVSIQNECFANNNCLSFNLRISHGGKAVVGQEAMQCRRPSCPTGPSPGGRILPKQQVSHQQPFKSSPEQAMSPSVCSIGQVEEWLYQAVEGGLCLPLILLFQPLCTPASNGLPNLISHQKQEQANKPASSWLVNHCKEIISITSVLPSWKHVISVIHMASMPAVEQNRKYDGVFEQSCIKFCYAPVYKSLLPSWRGVHLWKDIKCCKDKVLTYFINSNSVNVPTCVECFHNLSCMYRQPLRTNFWF